MSKRSIVVAIFTYTRCETDNPIVYAGDAAGGNVAGPCWTGASQGIATSGTVGRRFDR